MRRYEKETVRKGEQDRRREQRKEGERGTEEREREKEESEGKGERFKVEENAKKKRLLLLFISLLTVWGVAFIGGNFSNALVAQQCQCLYPQYPPDAGQIQLCKEKTEKSGRGAKSWIRKRMRGM